MEIIGKITNNKIFTYKFLLENISNNYENFLKVVNKNDKAAVADYINILYKKLKEQDNVSEINKSEELQVYAEVVEKRKYKIVLLYIRNTFTPYDISNVGIVIDTEINKINYFLRLNKPVFVDGEFGNVLHIENGNRKLIGYIDMVNDATLTKEFMKYTLDLYPDVVENKERDKTINNLVDSLSLENLKNVSKRNLENLKNLTKENFKEKDPRKAMPDVTEHSKKMRDMAESIAADFNVDINNVNIDFTSGATTPKKPKKEKVRPYDEDGEENKKINYINKLEYTEKEAEKPEEEIKLSKEEKYILRTIYDNKWVREYSNKYDIFDMCDTSSDQELGALNILLKYKLERYDTTEYKKNISVVNCGRCKKETCPISKFLEVNGYYENKTGKLLESEYLEETKRKESEENVKEVIEKLKRFDRLSFLMAEIVLKSNLITDFKAKTSKKKSDKDDKKENEKNSVYTLEYVDLESLRLNTPKESLIKNLLDIYNNEEIVKEYIRKDTIDLAKIDDMKIDSYTDIMSQNPYHLAAYIKHLSEEKEVSLYTIFKSVEDEEYLNIAKQDLKARNYDLRINNLFLDKKSKDSLKKIVSYAKKYSENDIDYIPFDLRLYTDNNELVEEVARVLRDIFNDYGYIKNEDVRSQSFYNIESHDMLEDIYGESNVCIIILKDVFSLENLEKTTKERIVNKLEEVITKNHGKMITMLVETDKLKADTALSSNAKLKEKIFDFELTMDKATEQDIYIRLLTKLEKAYEVTDDAKVLLLEYINSTYNQATVSFNEYSAGLYEKIIFSVDGNTVEKKDIPDFDRNKTNDQIFAELNELVGLHSVKEALLDLSNLIDFKVKTEGELSIKSTNLHMVFLGNPGTGKTTVARMVAGILYNLKYIKYNKFVEVSSKDLVAKYVGQTAPKTMEVVEKALGGVLFIDEAYSLATGDGGEGSFNDECIATLIQAMENYRDNLVVIFAGYKKEMQDFLDSNSGIVSRIGYTLDFVDYSVDELIQIFKSMVSKAGFKITDEAIDKVKEIIEEYKDTPNFGNARFARTLYEKVVIRHAKNMKNVSDSEKLRTIGKDDISSENILKM